MTVALDFEEEYSDPHSEYVRYRIATGWNPVDQRDPGPDLEAFLKNLPGSGEKHGERFLYRSPNSDMLGLVAQETAGMPLADAFSTLLWQPMGARNDGYVSLDRNGLGRAAGGICVTLADLARVGQLLIQRGARGNRQVIPESWVEDTWNAGSRAAWLHGNYHHKLPDGRYRNQWYQVGDADNCLHARGIHGQLLYINPARDVVIARLSSQPDPLDDALTAEVMAAFHHVAALLGDHCRATST
jgi:CubicO group peptidase (beta-lactamase class C family)